MILKELWKSMSAPFTGGIIATLIGLLSILIYFLFEHGIISQPKIIYYILCVPFILVIIFVGIGLCGWDGGGILNCNAPFQKYLVVILVSLAFLVPVFFLGYLIGWIVQKIENKKA